MSDNDVTTIQIIKGQDAGGARRSGLTPAQLTGRACVVCQGTENLNQHIGLQAPADVPLAAILKFSQVTPLRLPHARPPSGGGDASTHDTWREDPIAALLPTAMQDCLPWTRTSSGR